MKGYKKKKRPNYKKSKRISHGQVKIKYKMKEMVRNDWLNKY